MSGNQKFVLTFFTLILFSVHSFACTTFIISGKYTADGKPVLFKNRDTKELNNSLVYFEDGKYDYIGVVNGDKNWKNKVWGGYNSAGFAIMNSAAYNNNIGDTTSFQDQEGIVMKLALQNCETLEDFENLLNSLPKPWGVDANFGVIDAYGGAAYYETGNYDFKKYDANDPQVAPNGIIVRTNHSLRGDLTKGFGYCRFNTASQTLNKAASENKITSQFLLNNISRNLTHSLTQTDLRDRIPLQKSVPEYRFFLDYIPRISTSSAMLVVGARDKDDIDNAMMWTILGFPLTSVAVPCWITGGADLPKIVSQGADLKAPICNAALKLKEECFPRTYDHGTNYINLAALINQQNDGIMQLLLFLENEIFNKANELLLGKGHKNLNMSNVQDFYDWIDLYLTESYSRIFGIDLSEI